MNIMNELTPFIYREGYAIYRFEENGGFGLVSMKRSEDPACHTLASEADIDIITPAIWDEIRVKAHRLDDEENGPLYLTYSFFVRKRKLWHVLSESGHIAKELCFSRIEVSALDDGRNFYGIEKTPEMEKISPDIIVEKNCKKGVLTSGMFLLVPIEYDSIQRCYCPVFRISFGTNYIVQKNNQYGVYDFDGRLYIPIEYDKISFYESRTSFRCIYDVWKSGKMGVLNAQNGEVVVPIKWDRIEHIILYKYRYMIARGCLYKVFCNQKYGIHDQCGMLIPPVWDEIVTMRAGSFFDPNCFNVRKDSLWGCYDRWGKCICEAKWDEIGPFINGVARVCSRNSIAYMDTHGEIIENTIIDGDIPEQLQSIFLPNCTDSCGEKEHGMTDDYMVYDGNYYTVKLDEDDIPWFFRCEKDAHHALVTSLELATKLYEWYREMVSDDFLIEKGNELMRI